MTSIGDVEYDSILGGWVLEVAIPDGIALYYTEIKPTASWVSEMMKDAEDIE